MTTLASDPFGEDFEFLSSYCSEILGNKESLYSLRPPPLKQEMVKELEVDSIVSLSIPLEVITDILSRLPFKTLQRFKCVCKTWLHLLTRDSYFGKLHCERVMVSLTSHYDFVMDKIGPVRRSYDPIVRRTSSSVSDYYVKGVYESFYGDGTTYSLRTLVRQLNASGFPQHRIGFPYFCYPYFMRRKGCVFFSNGLYEVQEEECRGRRMESLSFDSSRSLSLVLVPDKEAAYKINLFMQEKPHNFARKIHLCVEENSVWEDRHILRRGVNVVGTPGCMLNILQWQLVQHDLITKFTLFDADVIFSRGYKEMVYNILKLLPKEVHIKVISATIPREAVEIPRKFWDARKEEWKMGTPCDEAVEYMKELILREEKILLKHAKKSVKIGDFPKFKLREQRNKKRTISWNPHLKMHK